MRFMEKKGARFRGGRDIQARNYEGCQHPVQDLLVCKSEVKLSEKVLCIGSVCCKLTN